MTEGSMFLDRPLAELRKAYRILCSLVLISISMPAASQGLRGNCGNPDPDISISACTKKIQFDTADLQSGRQIPAAAAHLATDYNSRGVAYATKGLYVVICGNPSVAYPGGNTARNMTQQYQNNLKTFWQTLANNAGLKNAANVMFEICNEPIQIETSFGANNWGSGNSSYWAALTYAYALAA